MLTRGACRLLAAALALTRPAAASPPSGQSPSQVLAPDGPGDRDAFGSPSAASDPQAPARLLGDGLLRREVRSGLQGSREARSSVSTEATAAAAPAMKASPAPSCFASQSFLQEVNPNDENGFDYIYKHNTWGSKISLSGPGSTLAATAVLCKTLMAAMHKAAAGKPAGSQISVLDAPSGDFFWMPSCLATIQKTFTNYSFTYQGVDVSNVAVGIAEKKRSEVQKSMKNVRINQFQHVDLADSGSLASLGHFDVVMSHDCLQHNPTANVWKILQNFNATADFLVIDVDRDSHNFVDIPVGKFRCVDITLLPYSFTAQCTDRNTGQPKGNEDEWFAMFKLPLKH